MEMFRDLLEHPDALLVLGAFVLFWLVVLPRIAAPFVAKFYARLPASVRAVTNILLPTLEDAIRSVWINTYMTIQIGYNQTPSPDDDKIWQEVNDKILEVIDMIDGEPEPPA